MSGRHETPEHLNSLTSLHQQVEEQSVDEEEEVGEELCADVRMHVERSEQTQTLTADVQHASDL